MFFLPKYVPLQRHSSTTGGVGVYKYLFAILLYIEEVTPAKQNHSVASEM